jgi:hypothetical protein
LSVLVSFRSRAFGIYFLPFIYISSLSANLILNPALTLLLLDFHATIAKRRTIEKSV